MSYHRVRCDCCGHLGAFQVAPWETLLEAMTAKGWLTLKRAGQLVSVCPRCHTRARQEVYHGRRQRLYVRRHHRQTKGDRP